MENLQTPNGTQGEETPNNPASVEADTTQSAEDLLKQREAELESYKQKFSASAREAQGLLAEKEALKSKLSTYESSSAVDSMIREQFPEYDTMSESEKKLAKQNAEILITMKRRDAIEKEKEAQKKREADWKKVVESNEILKAKEEDFKVFASRHQNADLELLAKAFTADVSVPKSSYNSSSGVSTPPAESKQVDEMEELEDKFMKMKSPAERRKELAKKHGII